MQGGVFSPNNKHNEVFVCQVFIPDLPITKTCYECGHRFKTEYIINLYPDDYKTYGLVIISGEEVNYYELISECLKPIKCATITIHRLKKQKKGGQSAPRFQRTQLQQVIEYRKKIVDMMNVNVKPNIDGIIIAGIGELKDTIKNHDDLYPDIKHKIKYVISISSIDIKHVLPIIKPYITEISKDDEKKIISEIIEMIRINPDKLLFGAQEIKEKLELELIQTLYINNKTEPIIRDCNLNKVNVITLHDRALETWGSMIGVMRFNVGGPSIVT
jgi:peptide chain release factor subunit 1